MGKLMNKKHNNSTSNFQADLELGHMVEMVVAETIISNTPKGWKVEYNEADKSLPRQEMLEKLREYDFKLYNEKDKFTFEVKFDDRCNDTGNFFIEYESYDKPSGINSTSATFFVIFLNDDEFYIFYTKELRKYVANNYDKTVIAYSGTALGYVIEKSKLLTGVSYKKWDGKTLELCIN